MAITLADAIQEFARGQKIDPNEVTRIVAHIRHIRPNLPNEQRFTSHNVKPRDTRALRISLPAREFQVPDTKVPHFILWIRTKKGPGGDQIRKLMIKRT